MNPAALLKRAPTILIVAFLAYACYSIHASLPDSAEERSELAGGLDVMLKDLLRASTSEVRSLTKEMLRDPFRIGHDAAEKSKAEVVDDSDAYSLADFVSTLTLDATFLQGKTQIAIIGGRMYHRGEHITVQTETGKANSPLLVQTVQPHRVTLSARGKTYDLVYPDKLGTSPAPRQGPGRAPADGSIAEIDPEGELAFYKRLLNSPLGRMGKAMTGIKGPGAGANQRGTGSRSARSPRSSGWPGGNSP